MARITINMDAQTSCDGYSDGHCGVQLGLVQNDSNKVELQITERTDKLYFDIDELRKALNVLAAQDD